MEIPHGANIYEVNLKRLVTKTETVVLYVRANTEDDALEKAWAKAEYGGGSVITTRTDSQLADDDAKVFFVSKAPHAETEYS